MNTVALSLARDPLRTHSPAWGAVFSMALCVAVLIASEFMPVSLLTPIAQDLGMTEGRTGQAISISGIFAVLTSLLTAPLTGRFDRRKVLLCFTVLLTVSGALVTSATEQVVFMTGRRVPISRPKSRSAADDWSDGATAVRWSGERHQSRSIIH